MFIKIPFESEIEFKNNISEITKMSLEHDFNVNDGVVLGNFYISGEYRIHEVSVNTDEFKYTLPFTVELSDEINKDTVEFNIEDFTYEVKDGNILKVNIEYSLKAEQLEKEEIINSTDDIFERVDENELESELSFIDSFLEDNNEESKSLNNKEEVINNEEDDRKDEKENEKLEEEKKEEIVKEKRISNEEEKTIMDTIKDSDDTFVTYRIHIVKENETIESICTLYNVSSSLVNEYNNTENITIGDKILIPEIDE